MDRILLLVLLLLSGLTVYIVIPQVAPDKQAEVIQKWVSLGFNGLLFLIIMIESQFQYMNTVQAFLFLLLTIGVALSGVYWWIPTYIPEDKQHEATLTMFNILSLSVVLMNTGVSAVPVGSTYYQKIQGGLRRK